MLVDAVDDEPYKEEGSKELFKSIEDSYSVNELS